jgi:hypothetical protein
MKVERKLNGCWTEVKWMSDKTVKRQDVKAIEEQDGRTTSQPDNNQTELDKHSIEVQ